MKNYLALGDSMSIDLYTGKKGGGAASQFARRLPADVFQDLARDGAVTGDLPKRLMDVVGLPDMVTLTIGGNDLLSLAMLVGRMPADAQAWRDRALQIGERFDAIVRQLLMAYGSMPTIIVNTVYDPTDGDDAKLAEIGLPVEARAGLEAYNDFVRQRAAVLGEFNPYLMLCDAHELFRGRGYWSQEPWITSYIEPNLAGATALADGWLRLVCVRAFLVGHNFSAVEWDGDELAGEWNGTLMSKSEFRPDSTTRPAFERLEAELSALTPLNFRMEMPGLRLSVLPTAH